MRLIAILQLSCLVVLQVQILFSVLEFGFFAAVPGHLSIINTSLVSSFLL